MNRDYVDVINENGQPSGVRKPRGIVHATGEWHSSIHIWLVKGDDILLQMRSKEKESFPGLFDVSVAGHVDAGESALEAAIRESGEEIGYVPTAEELQYVGCRRLIIRHPERAFISKEFNHIYILRGTECDSYVHDKYEIEYLQWKSLKDINSDLKENNNKYCIAYEEFSMINSVLNQ